MYCSGCGKEIADEGKFCKYCGYRIETKVKVSEQTNKKRQLVVLMMLILLISASAFAVYWNWFREVPFEDPLVERCVRESLEKEEHADVSKRFR